MRSASAIANRALTVFAAGFLAFDGACLITAGIVLHRPLPAIMGACLVLSSGLVFVYWRSYTRRTAEIAGERQALRRQARALRNLIQRN